MQKTNFLANGKSLNHFHINIVVLRSEN